MTDIYALYKETWQELTAPGAQFEVEEVEAHGNTIRSYKNAPPSLREVWLASAAFPDNDYLVYQDERLTYAEAHKRIASIANWLQSQGVGKGDYVAIAMRNYPEWLQAYWATMTIGATVVGMNAWWVGNEMLFALNDTKPKVLIADQDRLDRIIPEHTEEIGDVVLVGVRTEPADHLVPWDTLINHGGDLPDVQVDPDSDACIFYTSGTTGFPKGAQLTHRGCVANLFSLAFAGALGGAIAVKRGLAPADTVPPPSASLVTTPLFHVTANNCVAHGATLLGGKLVHMYKWDAGEALQLIERERITALTGVPVMAREVITHPDFESTDTSSLMSLGGGGAQLQPDLVGKIDEATPTARPNTGYGMTETCGIITSINGDYFVDKPASCGPAMPVYEAKCVDADGNEVPQGQPGELWVKGAQVIRGYLNREDATAETITDGWLHTGDMATIDEDGFIFIVDRIKDMVLRGGENVYCAEVESAIFEHDAVGECSVFGVPDDRLGEEVGVAVFLNEGASATADELREHCSSLIAKHKIPRYVWFSPEPLPRNASGKFLKKELRDTLKVEDAS